MFAWLRSPRPDLPRFEEYSSECRGAVLLRCAACGECAEVLHPSFVELWDEQHGEGKCMFDQQAVFGEWARAYERERLQGQLRPFMRP